ncbi:biotin carboxyl carrier protein of acetyl-CoA carboxylase 2, chloroplastic-like [Dorcoceras hygrometricum]|uniref:Biotin carboxyl carrier protein of acetyl-CoA carboxylase 2, chloroplastic-like n=1 Tax=Dorcoceras hygrometricum TaxID=472368 RepID=A0A2Z7A5R5_9LAMI|nr:biotin carboxyl carrier protein of acetyl-CoA carboxylase 2, chloroplastic-like [Dorcoceras hygrometricum]
MESAAVNHRSFLYAASPGSHSNATFERPGVITMNNGVFSNASRLNLCDGKIFSSTNRHRALSVSCVKTSETALAAKSNGDPNGAIVPESQQHDLLEKKSNFRATFPNGFEDLLKEVCDETQIAELKVKFGAFEIHMKRNIDVPTAPVPVFPQETSPPVPSKPVDVPTSAPPPPPKSSVEKVSPFTNVSVEKTTKLAAVEAIRSDGYVIVSSPTVGSFRRARTLKGKKQPPACKEGDVIKEGQVIGFLDQFGTELPVKSDVSGEVLKVLYSDGEAVGYGDPLIAVLPSFPGIK